jgi:hypothetical protein
MSKPEDRARVEAQVQACYSTWAKTYFDDYYARASAYLTAQMVGEARRIMAEWGVPSDRFWQGSVVEASDYRRPPGGYDAAICFGVFPHLPESLDEEAIANLHAALAPGGLVAIEARNQLFALFTLNRYSRDLFMKDLIGVDSLPASERDALAPALAALERRFRVDLPPLRQGKDGEPGYDEVLSRTHNPFVMRGQLEAAGFRDVRLHFYHYHALPPMLESYVPSWFRQRSLALEDPADWRGHFMASAFIVTGIKR